MLSSFWCDKSALVDLTPFERATLTCQRGVFLRPIRRFRGISTGALLQENLFNLLSSPLLFFVAPSRPCFKSFFDSVSSSPLKLLLSLSEEMIDTLSIHSRLIVSPRHLSSLLFLFEVGRLLPERLPFPHLRVPPRMLEGDFP